MYVAGSVFGLDLSMRVQFVVFVDAMPWCHCVGSFCTAFVVLIVLSLPGLWWIV